ncbi:HflC protein [gamma proteobacterium HTCC5015]|nr:HflC protein [gamma proteobacterium HTCC5015]
MRSLQTIAILGAIAVALVLASTFTVDEREFVIKKRLGEVEKADYEPGLQWKIPFVHSIHKLDKRLQTTDLPSEQYLTSEDKYMEVDSFVKWHIDPENVITFFTSTGGESRNNILQADNRLAALIDDTMKSVIAKHTIQEAINEKRNEIMQKVQKSLNVEAKSLGILVTDVRIKRLDFSDQVRGKVFERMVKDREKVAREWRATGQEKAKGIRAEADLKQQTILSDGYRQAEVIRGEADAQAANIYAKAFGRDEEFYRFYRSLDAYRNSFSSDSDMMVIDPKSDFFRYFNNIRGQ